VPDFKMNFNFEFKIFPLMKGMIHFATN